MTLQDASKLAIKLMTKHNLIKSGWKFEFDNSKSRFGACHGRYNKITLSKNLVLLNDEHHVKDTILHEIAHALVGTGHHHDSVWVNKAKEIGCVGTRCYSEEVVKPKPNYVGICPKGHQFKRMRLNKRLLKSTCSICDKDYNLDYKLSWIKQN